MNCNNGRLEECEIEYDEDELIAVCNLLPDEKISIAGQYGGTLPISSGKGEYVVIDTPEENIMMITFITQKERKLVIYWNYCAYICGFSYDGNYFVLADDGGLTVIKRNNIIGEHYND